MVAETESTARATRPRGAARADGRAWVLLMPTIPSSDTTTRVKIWRQLQKVGAIALKNSVYVLPNRDECVEAFEWVSRELTELGCQASLCEGQFFDGATDHEIERRFIEARNTDYAELAAELRGVAKLLKAKRIGGAKLTSLGEQAAKLRRRFEELVSIGGHGNGTTSADFGVGFVFAIDRSSKSLQVMEPKAKRVVTKVGWAGGPDYVRWVASKREVWVTEPDQDQIELFSLSAETPPKLSEAGKIAVKGGPESLVVDASHDRAFTHLWEGRTVQITLSTRSMSASFPNGCKGSRGIALDAARGRLFAGCSEGKATVLDVNQGGKPLDSVETASGVDIISLNPSLHHLYLPASSDGSVAVLGISGQGKLSKLGAFSAAKGTHCATSDDHNRVWVCSPDSGSLLVFDDTFPPAE